MGRLLAISAVFLTSACVAGRSGIRDSEGGAVQIDASWRLRDGGGDRGDGSMTGRDGSMTGRDGSILDRDGSISLPDGSRPTTELTCDDDVDQDGDGATDCEDDDCAEAPCAAGLFCSNMVCGGCRDEPSETSCGDGADEDCDGMADCADPDCAGATCGPGGATCTVSGTCPCASGFTERICSDGTDDDCDGLIDCADPDCDGRSCAAGGMLCRAGECTCDTSIEFCNDRDEDCDGVIDDGCPADLTYCCPSPLGPFGGGAGTFSDPCPAGSALMGIVGRSSGRLDRIQPVCAELFMTVDLRVGENAYPVIREAPVLGAVHGGTGGTAFDDRCPDGDVVIGVRGGTDELGGTLTGIGLSCGTVRVMRAGLSWQRTITPTVELPLRGAGGVSSFDIDCEGGVITAVSGQAGTAVTGLGFTCQRLTLETL